MIKIFANKNIWKKIVLVLLVITLFSFAAPQPVAASIGGELMKPICSLVVGLADGVVTLIQRFLIGQSTSFITVSTSTTWWQKLIGGVLIVVGLAAAFCIISSGAVVWGIIIGLTFTGGGVSLVSGLVNVLNMGTISAVEEEDKDVDYYAAIELWEAEAFEVEDTIDLPLIAFSPEEIFSNEIPVFDANFFSTDTTKTYTTDYSFLATEKTTAEITSSSVDDIWSPVDALGMTDISGEVTTSTLAKRG